MKLPIELYDRLEDWLKQEADPRDAILSMQWRGRDDGTDMASLTMREYEAIHKAEGFALLEEIYERHNQQEEQA